MDSIIPKDIHKDIKLLITTVTGFKENDPGYRTCKKFAQSRLNPHIYPTITPQQTKRTIQEIIDKFCIHGKEDIARKFRELVDTFLTSFDFERHPQIDLQWSLLTLLINLSRETRNSSTKNLNQTVNVCDSSCSVDNTEEIDWAEYLKEGEDEFFKNYESDDLSDWSEDDELDAIEEQAVERKEPEKSPVDEKVEEKKNDDFFEQLGVSRASKRWLISNVQNNWWNDIDWSQTEVESKFPEIANFCEFWRKNIIKSSRIIGSISEHKTLRELLMTLFNPAPSVLFLGDEKAHFVIRDNVSDSSLTPIAFKGILQPFCKYFTMIHEIESFGKKLYSRNDLEIGLLKTEPPATYEAYHAALINHLSDIKKEIMEIENKVMKQEEINTLLSVSAELRSSLHKLTLLYDVHKTVADDLFVTSNVNAVAKLLSGLYCYVEQAVNREEMYIYTSLYLFSITVYLNIIDAWMSDGRLEDWRDEFLISRHVDDLTLDEGVQTERFFVKPLNVPYPTDPLIEIILEKESQMGRNIDLLVTSGRVSELWDSSDECSRTSLKDEFLDNLLTEMSELTSVIREDDLTDQEEMEVDGVELNVSNRTYVLEIDEGIAQFGVSQLLQTKNTFLLMAFDFLPSSSGTSDVVDGETSPVPISDINKKLKSILKEPFSVREMIKRNLMIILDKKSSKASKLVKQILMDEYKLGEHLKLMRCIYMMESSHILDRFVLQFFSQIESTSKCNSFVLTRNLGEILSEKCPSSSSRWTVSIGVKTNQVLIAINDLNVHYAVGWPINILLNEATLTRYKDVFKFHLKLKWAIWTLNNLRFTDLEGSRYATIRSDRIRSYVKRLECLRFWLLHAIGLIHSYVCGPELSNLALILENALSQAENLETIINVHNEYLNKVCDYSLQTERFDELREIVINMLEMCTLIRKKWNRGPKSLTESDLIELETMYVKHHTSMALALHDATFNHKDSDSLTMETCDLFERNQKIFDHHLSDKFSQSMFSDAFRTSSSSESIEF